ncbi:MAG: hypothetical protein WBP11_07660 [Dokdonella sp.]
MTVLRCTAKLLKRLKQPSKPPEPEPQGNPLGEWYADLNFWNRKPYVILLNGATGATLTLNGNAAGLRALHERALVQFASLCAHFGMDSELVDDELDSFCAGFTFAATRDRSLLGSLNDRKQSAWGWFEALDFSLVEASLREWNGMYKHPSLKTGGRYQPDWHCPLDLLRERLVPQSIILPFNTTKH